jgi:phosphate starvation-inducible membrane PsiE
MADTSDARTAARVAAIEGFSERTQSLVKALGSVLVDGFHYLALFVIGAATVWAAAVEFWTVVTTKHHASIEDLLLLFIYLEIGAMVGIYFKTNHMPTRFLIYIGITAVTRHLIAVVNAHNLAQLDLLVIAGVILMLSIASLIVRYGSYRFPADPRTRDGSDLSDADASAQGQDH